MFDAPILGPLVETAALSLTGLIHTRPQREWIAFAQLLIGGEIEVSYVGITLRTLRRCLFAG